MILFLCRLRAANSARLFDTLRGSCREAGPFLRAAKSAFKDGKADCQDQFANWSRNDMVFTRGAVCGGAHGPRPTAEYFVGQGPRALPWVRGKNPPVTALPCQPPLGKGAINLSDASRPSSYRISQRTCWENIFYQLSFIPNRIDCSFSFQRLSVWMTSSSVSVFGRICKMENWKNLYRSGCAQITSFISLLCPCSEST